MNTKNESQLNVNRSSYVHHNFHPSLCFLLTCDEQTVDVFRIVVTLDAPAIIQSDVISGALSSAHFPFSQEFLELSDDEEQLSAKVLYSNTCAQEIGYLTVRELTQNQSHLQFQILLYPFRYIFGFSEEIVTIKYHWRHAKQNDPPPFLDLLNNSIR